MWLFLGSFRFPFLYFSDNLKLHPVAITAGWVACLCLLCMPVCPPAYLPVWGWIKEYSVFPYCRLPLLLLLWPSIVSCLETDRKEVLSSSLYTVLSPLLHAFFLPLSIRLFTSISQTLYPLHVFVFFSFLISNMLSLSSRIHSTDSSFHTMLVVSG